AFAETLIAPKEEEFVFLDRSAEDATELLEAYRCSDSGIGILRGQGRIAPKGVRGAVEVVGARLQADARGDSGNPTVFRLGIDDEVDFLDGVKRKNRGEACLARTAEGSLSREIGLVVQAVQHGVAAVLVSGSVDVHRHRSCARDAEKHTRDELLLPAVI